MVCSPLVECVCMHKKFLYDFLSFFVKFVCIFLFVQKGAKRVSQDYALWFVFLRSSSLEIGFRLFLMVNCVSITTSL
jgi:hypothetical protein